MAFLLQDAPPLPDPGPAAPDMGGLAAAIGGAFVNAIGAGLDKWLTGTAPEVLLRVLGWLVGEAARALRAFVGPLLGSSAHENLLVALPADLTTNAPWVRDSWALFANAATAALLGGMVCVLLVAALRGLAWGVTWDEAVGAVPAAAAALVGIRSSLDLAEWLRQGVNALSYSFVSGVDRLPGWSTLTDAQQASGEGLVAIGNVVLALLVALGRFITLETFNLCVVLSPLAVLLALIPGTGGAAQWVFGRLIRSAVVQVPQAIAIGQGAALVAAFGAGAGALSLGLGVACYWLAWRLPHMLPGFSGHGTGFGLLGSRGARLALMGLTMPANPAAGVAGIHEVARAAGGAWGAVQPALPPIEATYRLAPLAPTALRALPAPR